MVTALQFKIQARRVVRLVDVEATFVSLVGGLSRDSGTRDLAAFGSGALASYDPDPA